MELYRYKAKDILNNKIIKGEMETESEEYVEKLLKDKYLFPISIKKKTAFNAVLGELGIFKQPIKVKDIMFFCKQFAAMIQAGISVACALDICIKQTAHKSFKKHLRNIHQEVNRGRTLSGSMRDEKIFPDVLVSMMTCGEALGTLDNVLDELVEHFGNQLNTMRKLKKALIYPTIVIIVVIVVIFIMMIMVIPNFVKMFQDMAIELPVATVIVMNISNFFVAHWPIILVLIGIGTVIVFNIKKVSVVKKAADLLALQIPLFGKLNKMALAASFSKTMAMLVSSGLPMLQAMEIVKKVLNNVIAEEEINKAVEALKHGNTLHDAMKDSKIYPIIMLSMIHIGEETGELGSLLAKLGRYFNDEVQASIESLMILIEPILTLFIAVVVGGIMMAVMLPTFTAATAIM